MIDECNNSDYYNNRLKEPFGFFLSIASLHFVFRIRLFIQAAEWQERKMYLFHVLN